MSCTSFALLEQTLVSDSVPIPLHPRPHETMITSSLEMLYKTKRWMDSFEEIEVE